MSSTKQRPSALKAEAFVSHAELGYSGPPQGCVQGHLNEQGHRRGSLTGHFGVASAGCLGSHCFQPREHTEAKDQGVKRLEPLRCFCPGGPLSPEPTALAGNDKLLGPDSQGLGQEGIGEQTFVSGQSALLSQVLLGN